MKKILLLLLITTASYSQTLLKLKAIEYASGAGYCVITNSLGVQTYTPCSTLTNTTGLLSNTTTIGINGSVISLSVSPNFSLGLAPVLAVSGSTGDNQITSLNGYSTVDITDGYYKSTTYDVGFDLSNYFQQDVNFGNYLYSVVGNVFDAPTSSFIGAVNMSTLTALNLVSTDASKNLVSTSIGSGLILSGNVLSATGSGSTTTITAGTNVTVSGTAPSYTVSSASQSLSISGNTISLSAIGGSVTIPTQTTGLASTSSPTITSPTIATSANFSYATANSTPIFNSSSNLTSSIMVDLSATLTIVGWSSFTTKQITKIDCGSYNIWDIYLDGTSNSTTTTVALSDNTNASSTIGYKAIVVVDNGGAVSATGVMTLTPSSNLVTFTRNLAQNNFTASGRKLVIAQFTQMK